MLYAAFIVPRDRSFLIATLFFCFEIHLSCIAAHLDHHLLQGVSKNETINLTTLFGEYDAVNDINLSSLTGIFTLMVVC